MNALQGRVVWLCIGCVAGIILGMMLPGAIAHPGGLAADGAHTSRDTGVRHWHLEVPCTATPCGVGMLDAAVLDHLDPPPPECPALHDRIVIEAQRDSWLGPPLSDIAAWAVAGIQAGCWRVPRAPPGGESHL